MLLAPDDFETLAVELAAGRPQGSPRGSGQAHEECRKEVIGHIVESGTGLANEVEVLRERVDSSERGASDPYSIPKSKMFSCPFGQTMTPYGVLPSA